MNLAELDRQAVISIHVPREGDDLRSRMEYSRCLISIHVPREGDDVILMYRLTMTSVFQSTSPARGTTR